jgi:cysteine synthase A
LKYKSKQGSIIMRSRLATYTTKRTGLHNSIIDTIGKTPIIKLSDKLAPYEGVNVYVKLESENPGGSLKDRLAYGVVEWAEKHGHLQPGQTIVEASSGNTGIGLAMICASKGYPLVCVMSESFSVERRKVMRFYGAKVILTNPAHKATGMVIKAKELADKHGWFFPNQFDNEANAWIHEQTTGPEIIDAFAADHVHLDHFVIAYGTGGSSLGIGRVLRKESPATKIHLCEPSNAPMMYSGIETKYPEDEKPSPSFDMAHPVWRPHLFQGWAADFIPKLVTQVREEKLYDDIMPISGFDAIATSQQMAEKEGIFSGTSGGGTVWAALQIAKTAPIGTNILAMVPDTAERYLSTPLFENIPAGMTNEEKEISESTPSAPPPSADFPPVLPGAIAFVEEKNRSSKKIVVWSLEYCEFCWTLTRFLDRLQVPYERIDIDNFQFAKDNMGNKYRSALQDKTGCKTFPQFFISEAFIGGAVDACMMWKRENCSRYWKMPERREKKPTTLETTLAIPSNFFLVG